MSGIKRIVLIGFSGTGKSTVARLLAGRLGWQAVDMDAEIEQDAGKTIPEIFTSDGEPHFRAMERRALLAALVRERVIVATGGGAAVDPAVWTPELLEHPATLVVALDAAPETILDRLRRQHVAEGAAVERPMLAGEDPLQRIRALKERRQAVYDRAAVTLVVDGAIPEKVAEEISSLLDSPTDARSPSLQLAATSASSDIYIAPGARVSLGQLARKYWPDARKAWVISDETVARLHGESTLALLEQAGLSARLRSVPVGESSKSWGTAGELLDWVLDGGIERGDIVVALGGGVIGDLAGFVAAIALRGVALIQVPTSLLAMVDSSIGGKTGLNHRTGKNLIGAFYQPPVVVIDPEFLKTLPKRDLTAGWAEIIKHAVIQPSTPLGERGDLLTFLERNAARLLAIDEPAISYAIKRNVALKAAVVEADEKESGIRAFLNFGHTIGHAIEAADYRLLHGEAISVGMRAAMRLALDLDMVEASMVSRVDQLLDRFGLPATAAVDEDVVLKKMTSDKKRVAGMQRWVLPVRSGGVCLRTTVSPSAVQHALGEVISRKGHGGNSDCLSPED